MISEKLDKSLLIRPSSFKRVSISVVVVAFREKKKTKKNRIRKPSSVRSSVIDEITDISNTVSTREPSYEIHNVSKFHFWSKNYKIFKSLKIGQFLFLCQNWLFLAVKNSKCIWIFAPKLVKNCHFMVLIWGNFRGQIPDFLFKN